MQTETERALLVADSQARYERIEIIGDHLRFALEEDKPGLYIAAHPLSVEQSYFEIIIVDTGQKGAIGIGLVPYSYPLDTLPGPEEHSVCYRANFGKLHEGSSTGRKIGPICKIGDRLGCGINYTYVPEAEHDVQVVFTRNDCEICSVTLSNTTDPLHPAVSLQTYGEEVRLDLSAEWPIDRNISYFNTFHRLEESNWNGQLSDAIDRNDVHTVNQLLNKVAPVQTEETETYKALHIAAGSNLKQCVDFLLRNGADANLSDTHGWLPLHYAAKSGSLDCLETLLHFTRDINARDKEEWTALLFAANVASLECVAYILNHGGDVHVRNNKGETPLHRAALKGSLECVDILVRNGCNTESSDNKNHTPLHMAAESGSSVCVEYLIQHGAQVNARNDFGQTPLYHSTSWGSNEGTEVLLTNGADVNASNNDSWTPLHAATTNRNTECVKLLLEHGADVNTRDKDGQSPLYEAARKGNIECVKLLMEHGAVVNSSDIQGWSPLHTAAFNRNIECMKFLIQNGAGVNSKTHKEETALHLAAQKNSVTCLEKLIASGADINARMSKGVTALHLAAMQNSVDCVEKLIASGADINTSSNEGGTALHYAAKNNHVNCLEKLIVSGADINLRTKGNSTPLFIAVSYGSVKCTETLIAYGADVNWSFNGYTALRMAYQSGSVECIKILIKAGAAVNSRIHFNGATALHFAVYNSWINFTETLIAYGADVNSRANNGWTALHCAAKIGSLECIKMLIKAGADVNSRNNRNMSPSQTAAEEKHLDCYKHLQKLESHSSVDEIEIAEEAQEVTDVDGGKEQRAKEAEDAFLQTLLDKTKKDSTTVPGEILQDPYALNLYEKAIKDGIEYDRSIRINVVGNYGQGKTTLIRRLLDQDIFGVESTNGIDVQQLTCLRSAEGKLTYKQEVKINDDDILNRLLAVKVVEKERPRTKTNSKSPRLKPDRTEKTVVKETTELNFTDTDQKGIKHVETLPHVPVSQSMVQNKGITTAVKHSKPNKRIQMAVLPTKHKQYFENEAKKKEKEARKQDDTLLKFWDFGGQFIFYATHALFHSRHAIYLLVFDLSLPFNQFVIEEDCPIEVGKRCVDYYLRFWMNSIHSFVGTEDGKEPVVILVGTHKDKIPAQSSEIKKYIKEYFLNVRRLFADTKVLCHIYKTDFSIDNNDENDPELFALRKDILAIREERSKSITIPAKWIPLEKALDVIKDRKLVTLKTVFDIDDSTEFPIRDSEQIKLFLRYHHAKGSLVFFDEPPLSDYVILDPQFLIDAFKCIITSKRFYNNDHELIDMLRLLHTEARLEDSLIEYQWKKEKMFIENKNILLGFLEKHRIITQAREIDEAKNESRALGWYIVTSLLKDHQYFHDELKRFLEGKPRSGLQMVMEFKVSLIVEVVFHRLLAAVAGKWSIVKHVVLGRPQVMIYRNACVVLINDHAGIMEHNADSIRLAVVSCCPSVPIQSYEADLFRRFCEYVVQQEFQKLKSSDESQPKPYNLRFACNHEDHEGRGSKYYCNIEQNANIEHIANKTVRCPDLLSHDIDVVNAQSEWYSMEKFTDIHSNLELNEKMLSKLSLCIGENWELLGIQLGLTSVIIDHLKADNSTTRMRIYNMLLMWIKGCSVTKTLKKLVEEIRKIPKLKVDWDGIRNVADIQTDNEMTSNVKTEREEMTNYSVT